ncbi:MAG: EAL domain-containing protein [Clostridiales bacterium]|nr:EAL domain-containing protein [Clostridiales bacterium]MCF8022663.1 EAL domain-containing protein [Clostridiales bacterium]
MTSVEKIIEGKMVTTLYQPIYNLIDGTVVGFEALSRGPQGLYYYPNRLFTSALKRKCLPGLEMVCALKALERFSMNSMLFINFSAYTLAEYYRDICSKFCFSNLVIEVGEIGSEHKKSFKKAVDGLTKKGVQIALDDVGSGTKDFFHICEVPVAYFKIDKKLIQGMTSYNNARYYKTVVSHIKKIAEERNSTVIAEGVETQEQLDEVENAGIKFVQGFYLSKPLHPDFREELV